MKELDDVLPKESRDCMLKRGETEIVSSMVVNELLDDSGLPEVVVDCGRSSRAVVPKGSMSMVEESLM